MILTNVLPQWMSKVVFQILATIIANIAIIGQGCSIGWNSPSLPILQSNQSALSTGPLSVEEAAWVGSSTPLVAILGTALFGIILNYVGSKRSMMWCALPAILSWIVLYVATQPWHLYVARSLSGVHSGAIFLCISIYVAEIASDHIRGRLSSMMLISYNIGIVMGYIAGTTLKYSTVPLVMVTLPTTFMCLFIWLPHTPQFLLAINQTGEAEQSLRFYRNCYGENNPQSEIEVKEELQKLITIAKQKSEMPSIDLSDFLTADAIRAMLIGPTLMAAAQFSGAFTLSNYAATIFKETGSSFSPNWSAIIMGSNQLMGTIVASSLIDRLGRKLLLLFSSAGSALSLAMTGVYCYCSAHGIDVSSLNLLPVISLSAFIFITAIGMNPVPYVLVSEVLPQKIRRIGVTVCMCSVSLFAFVMLRYFSTMLHYLELYGCLWTFAAVSCFGFLFTLIVVRETNGINLDQVDTVEIQERDIR